MTRVFWDTSVFIYFFEGGGEHGASARGLRERMLQRGDQLMTSALTVGEILVKPRELQNLSLCKQFEEAITMTSLILPFDLNAARRFSMLRLDRTLKAPDAIQLACAASSGTDLFITNNGRFSGLKVDGVQFIVALDRAPI